MAVENSEIFLGSGASLTFVPEVDFFFKAQTVSTTAIQMDTTNLVQFQLVDNMYVGCTIDWYDAGVYTSSHLVTANDHDTFTITPALASAVDVNNDQFVLRGYGAPCPAPDSDNDGTGRVRLNADNWLGLVESATFPNIEVEMKQMNLQLGGSRNFTHQYKGMETASGASLNMVSNHVTWLYYFFGKCTNLSFAGGTNTGQNPSNFHTGTAAHKLYFHTAGDSDAHLDTGPFIYRVNSVSGGDHIMPPIMETAEAAADLDSATYPTATGRLISYTFAEANNSELPSFALEQSLSKLATNPHHTDTDPDAEDLNFVRVARGNRVNSMTLTANENEEVKMTMDLNTRAVTAIPQTLSYQSRGGQDTNTSLFNFPTGTGSEGFLEPFFFSDGNISIFGNQFLKITNFTLTMNNNLQDKRFIGLTNRGIKSAFPAQRNYEISLTALVTDDTLFTELLNTTENDGDGNDGGSDMESLLSLTFTKDNGETFTLSFKDYFTSANSWTIPDDKGPITADATFMPRNLHSCTTTTHWVLQG
tara:strand:- start:179 stop:1774 length:1596 start_codon:yes stop_codon:yes gene_type:complete